MRLTTRHHVGERAPGGMWEIEVSTGLARDERHSTLIHRGLSMDWFELSLGSDRFSGLLRDGGGVVLPDKHPWDAGNEWYITPLKEGVVVEHQWLNEYQDDGVGWYSWDLVRAVGVSTCWRSAMHANKESLREATSLSARFTIEVIDWQPTEKLKSLGWKSACSA
jgi:hypothetical protein